MTRHLQIGVVDELLEDDWLLIEDEADALRGFAGVIPVDPLLDFQKKSEEVC